MCVEFALRRGLCVLACLPAIASTLVVAAGAAACDTPVYRYAMYRWLPTPYEIYHFYDGEENRGDSFKAIELAITKLRDDETSPANVDLFAVDLKEDSELKTVPPDVRRTWLAKKDLKPPAYLVVNPHGIEVHSGPLQAEAIGQLSDSPVRRQVGQLLKQGNAAVFLMVPGKDEKLNKAAQEALDKVVKDVNSGQIELYSGPQEFDALPAEPAESKDKDAAADKPKTAENQAQPDAASGDAQNGDAQDDDNPEQEQSSHSVAALTLSAADRQAKEIWLHRMLLAVEGDLHEFTDEPMLFVIYGRGRALPPFIGKGISYENLVDCAHFITGACSCTVKDQNPGVDLLMAYDWQSAADAVAERFGREEGNEAQLSDLFPQLLIPGTIDKPTNVVRNEPQDPPSDAGTDTDVAPTDDGGTPPAAGGDSDQTDDAAAQNDDDTPGAVKPAAGSADTSNATPADADTQVADADTGREPQTALSGRPAPAEDRSSLLLTLGVGMAVAFVVLVAATFFILKAS